jgi:carbamoyltransferase
MSAKKILGISAFYHDSAACLVIGGRVIAAAQEERFTRKKHDPALPKNAIEYCLEEGGLGSPEELDHVVFYDKPMLTFERLFETYARYAPAGFKSFVKAMPVWLKDKLWMREHIKDELNCDVDVLFTEHHESHAASAFFPSPFQDAAILTMDGVGEWATASLGHGKDNRIEILQEIHFPHSLGLLYSAFTYFTGFKVNSGEYKLMGLAPYGTPRYVDEIYNELIDLKEDGSFKLNMRYFGYPVGLRMTNNRFAKLFGGPRRSPESALTQREMDLAASVQKVTEEAVLRMARYAQRETGSDNLVLAGGVALNCVGNGRVLREGPFKELWIQPAAGDAGGALGAALFVHHQLLGGERQADGRNDSQQASLLGPSFDTSVLKEFVESNGIDADRFDDEAELTDRVAERMANGKIIGWFQGRMEFGPRALGNRSILGTPKSAEMQTRMNLMIKFRESFRPFAPSVLREDVHEYFELDYDSPYMLIVAGVHPDKRRQVESESEGLDKLKQVRSEIPAITHVDYSARIQTVDNIGNPLYHRLISAFKAKTGCSVIVNTSFNVRGEPIVRTPEDAYRCFTRTHMDVLVLGPYVIERERQTLPPVDESWKSEFELD